MWGLCRSCPNHRNAGSQCVICLLAKIKIQISEEGPYTYITAYLFRFAQFILFWQNLCNLRHSHTCIFYNKVFTRVIFVYFLSTVNNYLFILCNVRFFVFCFHLIKIVNFIIINLCSCKIPSSNS